VKVSPEPDVVHRILALPVFQASWVLYFLLCLSLVSIAIMIERAYFDQRREVDMPALTRSFSAALDANDYAVAAKLLEATDALETSAVLFGLRKHGAGPEAVEDLIVGATLKQRETYEARLDILATLASNAPFVGLFGTVLGIIRAFSDLSSNVRDASSSVMVGVAEALVATAAGLFVAIPAVVAFNLFKRRVKLATNNAQLLAKVLLAHLKAEG